MQDRHLCFPPYFFLGPAVTPHFFHSRIATAYSFFNLCFTPHATINCTAAPSGVARGVALGAAGPGRHLQGAAFFD